MDYLFKTTHELTQEERDGIIKLFEEAFDRRIDYEFLFEHYYFLTPLGYSYHALLKDNNRIMGHNAYVPLSFYYQGRKMLFVDTVSSMMSPECRDFMLYYKLLTNSYKKLKEVGIPFVYGHPNDNAYPVVSKSKLLEDIGRMDLYFLPVRIGCIKKSLRLLNPCSRLFCYLWVKSSELLASKRIYHFGIEQDKESFKETRYKRDEYERFISNDCEAIYKFKEYNGIRTAFLMEVYPKSPSNFVQAVNHILRQHKADLDLIMYPGTLPFATTGMIKLPLKYHPKQFHFSGHVINPEAVEKDYIMNIENWDENLSIYDLV